MRSKIFRESLIIFACLFLLVGGYFVSPHPTETLPETTLFIPDRLLHAKAAFAYDDTRARVLYEKESDLVVPLASLTKIMTAVVALENLTPEDSILITHEAILQEGANGLQEDSYWKRDDLLRFMLVESSNDAAFAVAEAVEKKVGIPFTTLMNNKAEELGFSSFTFNNSSGLDQGEISGGYGDAKDVAGLLMFAWKNYPDIFSATQQKELTFVPQKGEELLGENTNKDILSYPGRLVSKTGLTNMAGGNLGVVLQKGPLHDIVIVVLGSGEKERFSDVALIAQRIFATH